MISLALPLAYPAVLRSATMLETPDWRRAFAVVALICGAFIAGCARSSSPPVASPAGRNVVIITIDTMRADRLGSGFTPALDGLAQSGRRFVNARTPVPLTLPAHVTLLTGALPPVHGARENGVVFKPSASVRSLARVLKDQGYSTGAFVGAYVLNRRFGLADGFDIYDDTVNRTADGGATLESERRGDAVGDAAIGWLKTVREPFFAWIHFYDPHAPYEPPSEYRALAGGDAYNGEVAFADAQVARILSVLRERGPDSTTVVVAGDHGEGLGEHGEQTHGMLAYDSTLRVPLVIAGPAVAPGTVAAPVSLADVAPSLLARLGVSGMPAGDGTANLFVTIPSDRDTYAETLYPRAAGWRAVTALAGERWKLLLSSEAELYDLGADPGELRNLASAQPRIVEGMSARIQQLTSTARATDERDALPAETAERLRALGYVSGSASERAGASGPNPARVIAAWTMFEAALSQVNQGRAQQALPALRDLAKKFPDSALFLGSYARALKDTGRAQEAVTVYKAAIARNPDDPFLFHDLAIAAREAGDAAEAVRAEQAALALNASDPSALNGLGLLYADMGKPADAASAFERATGIDPSNPSYWANLGNARRELGEARAAEEAYRRALAIDGGHADAANGLGVLFVQEQRAAEAIPWFEKALARAPDLHEARLNLGIAYQENGNRAKAAETYRDILKNAPPRFRREREAAAELLKSVR